MISYYWTFLSLNFTTKSLSCDLVKIVFLIFWPLGVTSLKICPTILREPYPFLYRNWICVYLDNHTNTYKYSRIRPQYLPIKLFMCWTVVSIERCVIFLKMVSKNYSNILREFSEKLTEKLENSLTSKHIK